jgi:hypothetical protein
VEQKKIMEKRMQQYQPEGASTNDPFSYDNLVAQHNLEYFKKEAAEGEAEGEEPAGAGGASEPEAE